MCAIGAIIGVAQMGLSMASMAAQQRAQQAQIDNQNWTRALNRQNALVAYGQDLAALQGETRSKTDDLLEQGFDKKLEARAAASRQRAMSASNGAAGITPFQNFNALIAVGARNTARVRKKVDNTLLNFERKATSFQTQAQNRINQNQPLRM